MGFLNKMRTALGGDDSALMASGLLGRGEIQDVGVTGSSVQTGGAPPEQICVFQVLVYLDDTPPFPAQVRKRIPVYALARPEEVIIDWQSALANTPLASELLRPGDLCP